MSDKKIFKYLLSTDGVNQLDRRLLSLDPSAVKIDGRSKQDILRFLIALSEEIKFFGLNDQPQGTWKSFLLEFTDGNGVLDESQLNKLFSVEKNCPPHLALIMAFLKIFAYVQEDLNKLTAKRLNFYFEEVLRIKRRPLALDRVHVYFELAKDRLPFRLEKGTLLDGGVSPEGVPLLYALDSECIVTQSKIGSILLDYIEEDIFGRHTIYKAMDARKIVGLESGWRPFGPHQAHNIKEDPLIQPASLGCAIASPHFNLAEGLRTVSVIFHLQSNEPESEYDLRHTLDIQMTAEKGWISPDRILSASLVPNEENSLNLTLTIVVEFKESSPPIIGYLEEIHQKKLDTNSPAWSMTVKAATHFQSLLSRLYLTEVEMEVKVTGIRDLVIQNDQSLQSIDSPVVPFGHAPTLKSNFYIGSNEIFSKSITSLDVNLEWKDVPDDMATHYLEYGNPRVNNSVFQADLYLLSGKSWHLLTPYKHRLFNPYNIQNPQKMPVNKSQVEQITLYKSYSRQSNFDIGNRYSQNQQQGFIKIVLTRPTKTDLDNLPAYAPLEAFGHSSFIPITTQHALQIASGDSSVALPKPPYTPILSSVKLDYSASEKFRPNFPNGIDRFFTLDVFGASESKESETVNLVPKYPYKGAFYIGLENAGASQIISLFFQIDEGSTPGTEMLQSSDIKWEYLAGAQWKEIPKNNILEDKTEGFQVSGLIRLVLGPDATSKHFLMPENFHWIRASIDSNSEGAADIQQIFAQSASATLFWENQGINIDQHLSNPLPANTIKSLKLKQAAIKKVNQPIPSASGRPSETDWEYHQRVHERLRHRNRAVTGWDFERLVLETFPEIFKVKALPHTDINNQMVPGSVKLVVVPDWRKKPTGNPLQPKANSAFLRTIKDFIDSYSVSPFTQTEVSNPVYETILVDCKISFLTGYDPGFYTYQLNEDLKKFLSPWSYDEGEDIVFGGKIHSSEIQAFIEGRQYVDYIIDFAIYHRFSGSDFGGISEMQIDLDFEVALTPEPTIGPPGSGKIINSDFVIGVPVEIAAASRPDAILVSNTHHRIGVHSEDICIGTQEIGIGQMVVGLDFILVS
ncbi:baseplate J/gp47 family protein [Lunatibacter salilacus]|uniref:baseplate J/gp47 family protein n=1 Tax=Lunatibacter salilacus TaxID=2483804 RepID=UPI00131ABFC2|nr:baseplate J/gp47 family protein [Lunatibacter salilacus]